MKDDYVRVIEERVSGKVKEMSSNERIWKRQTSLRYA